MEIDKSKLYIRKADLDAFLEARTHQGKRYYMTSAEEGFNNAILKVRSFIKTVNCVEAEPVKHGKWISRKNAFVDYFECSYCHDFIKVNCSAEDLDDWFFCPKCGAKMDGDTDGT